MAYRNRKRIRGSSGWRQKLKTSKRLSWLEEEKKALERLIDVAESKIKGYQHEIEANKHIQQKIDELEKELDVIRRRERELWYDRPNFIKELFQTGEYRAWETKSQILTEKSDGLYSEQHKLILQHDKKSLEKNIRELQYPLNKWRKPNLEIVKTRIEVVRRKNEKQQRTKAIVARAQKKSRVAARSMKSGLEVTELCPYCAESMSDLTHADHILPIDLGGMSIESNMVHVCSRCNLEKSNMTLLEFCEKKGFDFLSIAQRLRDIGKRV